MMLEMASEATAPDMTDEPPSDAVTGSLRDRDDPQEV